MIRDERPMAPLGPLFAHQFFCADHGGEFNRPLEVLECSMTTFSLLPLFEC